MSAPDIALERLEPERLQALQLERLKKLLSAALPSNAFYTSKLRAAGIESADDVRSIEDLRRVEFTTKSEISKDQLANPPFGSNLTYPLDDYILCHQTSGTTGQPYRCLDTKESWAWWAECWASVYRAAGVTPADRVFIPFSFGPFIGFWSAHEGAKHYGSLVFAGGGMSSYQRIMAVIANEATVLVCTPTYALHLGEVAAAEGVDLASSSVRITIHAGEPGASIPSTKRRIEELWGAKCFDHAGASEVGAWGFECEAQAGVHVNESQFIYEVIDPATGERADEGELVLTNLGRLGHPIIRYRTGDHVTLDKTPCSCGRTFVRLAGGVTGRVDDCLIIRGTNVFPSAIENVVRAYPEVVEFAIDVYRQGELDEIDLRLEVPSSNADAVAGAIGRQIRNGLGLRIGVHLAEAGSLPRPELKARRVTDHRKPG